MIPEDASQSPSTQFRSVAHTSTVDASFRVTSWRFNFHLRRHLHWLETSWRPCLLLGLVSFGLATFIAWYTLDAMPHLEDEHAYLYQAKLFARGQITNPAARTPEAFYIPYIILKDGAHFAKYPPGYPLLLTFGVWLGQPWITNSIAVALGIWATWLLGRTLFDHNSGMLAAILGVLSPMYLLLSGTLLSHPTSHAFLTLFAWTFVRARQSTGHNQTRLAWLAGMLGGFAIVIRPWTALGIGAPFVLFALTDALRRRDALQRVYGRLATAFVVASSPWFLYNWIATGSPLADTYRMMWDYDTVGFGPQIGNHHTWEKALGILSLNLEAFQSMLTGWPLIFGVPLIGVVLVLGILLPPHTKVEPLLLVPPITLISIYLAYWASSTGLYGPRYYAEGMPFLWILAARGLLKAYQWKLGRTMVMVVFPVCVLWGITCELYPRLMQAKYLYTITPYAATQIQKADIHKALVFVHSFYWTDYAQLSWLNEPDLQQSDIVYAEDKGCEINARVIQDFHGRNIYYYDRYQLDALVSHVSWKDPR